MVLDVWGGTIIVFLILLYLLSTLCCLVTCITYVFEYPDDVKKDFYLPLLVFVIVELLLFTIPVLNTLVAYAQIRKLHKKP